MLGLFAAGVVALAGWVWRDLRVSEPFIDLKLLASRPVLFTNAATLLLGHALFALYFLIPFLVSSHGHGYDFGDGPVATGLYPVPAAVGQLAAGSASGLLTERLPTKWVFRSAWRSPARRRSGSRFYTPACGRCCSRSSCSVSATA